jgi:hypothetical protein
MRSILALVLAVSMFVTPLAIAGGLSSSDSGFLFKSSQVSATAISDQEMKGTQGSFIALLAGILGFNVNDISGSGNNVCFNLLAGCGIQIVGH